MSKHTPGPWKVDKTVALGAYGVWADGGGLQICSMRIDHPREPRDANARLIAASPDLLAFVREVVADIYASQNNAKVPRYADMLRRGLELLARVDGEGK